MAWTLAASSLGGSAVAEIDNADPREITQLLGRTNTVSFTVPSSSALTPHLASTNILIDAYDGAVHRFRGRVISYNRVVGDQGRSMAVVAADPSWVFPLRRIGKSVAGYVSAGALDRGLIAKTLIDQTNAERHTGVRTGTQPYLAQSLVSYSSGPFKPLSVAVNDLSAGTYGFDWNILPVKGVDGVIGDWIAAPLFGDYNPDVLFHYVEGGGGSMKAINDSVSKLQQANRVYHPLELGAGGAISPIITSATDASVQRIINEDGLYEDVASEQLYDNALRQQLVDAHVQLRRVPKRTITFQPQDYNPLDPGGVPRFGVDYNLGDIVRARAEDEWGVWFDAFFRVYGWTAKPSKEGLETGDLLLIADGVGQAGVA
jgi:hypothetical protein